jgi:gamma-glutamyltranspeptidase / glutathione hydrolase
VSERNGSASQAEPAFLASPQAAALTQLGHVFTTTSEIGAATGIESLGGGQLLAAAEPVRRGGGSAGVVVPADDLDDQTANIVGPIEVAAEYR